MYVIAISIKTLSASSNLIGLLFVASCNIINILSLLTSISKYKILISI